MHFPSKWWIHMLPGFIVICGFSIQFIGLDCLASLWQQSRIIDIASSVSIAAASYFVGYTLNALLIEIVAPVLRFLGILDKPQPDDPGMTMRFEQYASPTLVGLLYEGHDLMVFNRSLVASVIIFDCCLLPLLCVSTLHGWLKIGLIFIALLSAFALAMTWWRQRKRYHDHMAERFDLVAELLSSRSQE